MLHISRYVNFSDVDAGTLGDWETETMQIHRPQSRLEYISGLELASSSGAPLSLAPSEVKLADGKPAAYVDCGSAVAFVSGVSAVQQQDVLNSALLAQLAANHDYDREKQTDQWYARYREVLENVGWVIQSFQFMRYESSGATIRMDKAALEIIAAIASGNEAEMLTATLSALEKLDPDSRQMAIFDANGSSNEGGNFQLGTASLDENGNVTMAFGAFYFEATKHEGRFLFWSWETQDINIYSANERVILNEQIYATVRQAVIDKLGPNAQKFVADIEI